MEERVRRGALLGMAGLLIVLAAGSLWWTQVRQDTNRVFWDMISNNLSTSGVTHISLQSSQQLSVLQYTQVSFTQHPTAHALTVIKQNGNTLATEEISDKRHDFVRYQQIAVPSQVGLDSKGVLGKWARLQSGQTVNGQVTSGLFRQSLLDILPIGNLSPNQRAAIIGSMHKQALFAYNPKLVKKAAVKGRQEYLYTVTIKPVAYIRIMQQFESLIGGTAYALLRPAQYASSQPISVVISVDARSHELAQIYETATNRAELYQGFGIPAATPLPKATITTTQLTQRLGQLKQ